MSMLVPSIVSAQPPLGYSVNAGHPPASGYPVAPARVSPSAKRIGVDRLCRSIAQAVKDKLSALIVVVLIRLDLR